MKNGLYHKQIGLPVGATLPWTTHEIELVYSEHARQEAQSDRYANMPFYSSMEFAEHEVIEVEVQDQQPVKAVLRIPCEDHPGLDMVLVLLAPEHRPGNNPKSVVKTVWFNRRSDSHKTLRRHLYQQP